MVLEPEEWVRQHVLHHLNAALGYPLGCMSVEHQLTLNGMSRRADIVAFTPDGTLAFSWNARRPTWHSTRMPCLRRRATTCASGSSLAGDQWVEACGVWVWTTKDTLHPSPNFRLAPAFEGAPCVLSQRNEDHDILAVAGKPGLYQVLASGSSSIVVESMVDGKRSSVPGTARVSNLADITMYTHDDDVPLLDILNRMHDAQKGAEGPSHKDAAQTIRDFVDGIAPELDHDRVYQSDLKKLVQWYNLLVSKEPSPSKPLRSQEGSQGRRKKAAAKKPAAKKATKKKKLEHEGHQAEQARWAMASPTSCEGHDVVMMDRSPEKLLERALATIGKNMDRMVAKEKSLRRTKTRPSALTTSTDLAAAAHAELVVTENVDLEAKDFWTPQRRKAMGNCRGIAHVFAARRSHSRASDDRASGHDGPFGR